MNTLTHDERLVLIGLITDPAFAAKAFPVLHERHFTVRFTRVVFEWCHEHIKTFQKPPGRTIQEIYTKAVEAKEHSEDVLELVRTFLTSISKELDEDRESIDTDFLLSRLTEFVKARDVLELKTSIDMAIQNADFNEAENAVANFTTVKLSDIEHVDLCLHPDKAFQILQESLHRSEGEGLFAFPGDLGQLTGPFQRGDLIAFAAPSKRGKTWWMQEAGILAAKAGRKTVIFSLEMSSGQLIARITRRLARRPRVPKVLDVPKFDDTMLVHDRQTFDACLHHLTVEQVSSLYGRLSKDGGGLIVQAYPAFTASVADLKSFLNYLETACAYKADVVIIDYADIVRSDYKGEYRHQIDHTWKMLRSMAQERDCLVITATHTNKNTYTKNIRQADMSEDSRKLNHISCMIALNQTDGEKSAGIMRASVIASRHDNFSSEEEVVVLQCLDLACPCLDSKLKTGVHNYEEMKNGLHGDVFERNVAKQG